MKNKTGCMTLACFLWLVVLIIGWCCIAANKANAVELDWDNAAQFLMVDQRGNIVPQGYAAGLTEIARAEAAAETTRQASELVTQTTEAAGAVVQDVVTALTGAYGFAYVTGHTISFSGVAEVNTNAAAYIVYVQFGSGGSMTTNGTDYTGHFIWHAYSDTMNTMPAVKYKRNLNGTNAWEYAEYQSTAQFDNTTVNGVLYPIVYRSTVWMPSIYNSAFFMAFCEIESGGTAGGKLDVYEGITVNGKAGITGDVSKGGYVWHYESGLLMSVTNEVP